MTDKLFKNAELSPEILRAVEGMNYTEMTDIQAAAIPLIMQGHDVIGRSSTGTGKTAAFGIPAVESVAKNPGKGVQVLILSPTRELAMQISEELRKYSTYMQGVALATVYGGQSMDIQIRQLRIAKIVVGTPGRIMDHMRRRTLKLGDLKMVVLDEADEMLNMGFIDDIKTILSEAPEERQTILFSATMPKAIMDITSEFQKNPEIVAVDRGKKTTSAISQCVYEVQQSRKVDALNLLLQFHNPKRALVFCNTKKMVDELVENLDEHGFRSAGLHGDMKQAARTQVMQDFKRGRTKILVATDVAARGIDVDDVEAVYNYDIPQEFEYYIHRIGRTGRAGKEGASHSLATNRMQIRKVREIENYIKAPIKLTPLPTAEQVHKAHNRKQQEKIRATLAEKTGEDWKEFVGELIGEGHDPVAIAASLIEAIAGRDKKSIPIIKSVPARSGDEGMGHGSNSRGGRSSRLTLKVNIGIKQKLTPNFIVGAIVQGTGMPAKSVGKIQIFQEHTTVDMGYEDALTVLENMKNTKIKNCPVEFTAIEAEPSKKFGDSKFGDSKFGDSKYRNRRSGDFRPRARKPKKV